MQSYQAARGLFNFVGSIAWIAVIGGGLIALLGGSAAASAARGNELMAMLLGGVPGAILAFVGFFILVHIQTSRAAVDTAEYTQQMLKVTRDAHDTSKQLLKLAQAPKIADYEPTKDTPSSVRFDTDKVPAPAPTPVSFAATTKTEYGGYIIKEKADRFLVDDREFDTLIDAKLAIDSLRLRDKPAQGEAK